MKCDFCNTEMIMEKEHGEWEMGAEVVVQEWTCSQCVCRHTETLLASAGDEMLFLNRD